MHGLSLGDKIDKMIVQRVWSSLESARESADKVVSGMARALVDRDRPYYLAKSYRAVRNALRPINKCDELLEYGIHEKMRDDWQPGPINNDDDDDEDPMINERVNQEVFQRFFFPFMVNCLVGLYCLLHIPSITLVLKVTNASDNPLRAFLRYLDTLLHVIEWFGGSQSKRNVSLKTVRTLHRNAYRRAVKKGLTVAFSQHDLVLTQWAFVAPLLLWGDKMGFGELTESDKSHIIDTFYVVGRDLGIDDKYNLCLGSTAQVESYADAILKQVIGPAMQKAPESGMAKSMLQGANIMNPLIEVNAFKAWSRNMVIGESNVPSKPWSKLMLCVMKITFDFLFVLAPKCFLCIGNALMRLDIYLCKRWKKFLIRDNLKKYSL